MFSIGDFAALGRVSVRMLRHYDGLGLLEPARALSGYRYYRADQLHTLNRITALKELGFSLAQVKTILHDDVGVDELRGMLRLRRAELDAQLAADQARLRAVEVRLRMIESEGVMSTDEIVVKSVPSVRVAALQGTVSSYESREISPVIQPLYQELCAALDAAGVTPTGPGISFYDGTGEDGQPIRINAGFTVSVEADPSYGFQVVDLAAIPDAATIVHRGSVDTIDASYQALATWISAHGYRMLGHSREVLLEYSDDPEKWVNEIQMAVEKA
ncbi:MerR family transcriptional regulator [Cryptosporangium aurantiacum]|uniref:DNA-binding transcriptional regulator, MerR family n=1 Tax=Cryptosporangium aurantiacum TaxID=134849 RepID=A0A1M7RDM8_9ACTN|nr:MerR family transcriptional regulator [Cryptosporangium aurantiacum]SHN44415.1 DNA-binding transcriptional regulator, MerR family [Cryptosporangium aurantiacum]